jgi:hypothetical protein
MPEQRVQLADHVIESARVPSAGAGETVREPARALGPGRVDRPPRARVAGHEPTVLP